MMQGAKLTISLSSILLLILTGCQTTTPDRGLQAKRSPTAARPKGIVSSIAQKFRRSSYSNSQSVDSEFSSRGPGRNRGSDVSQEPSPNVVQDEDSRLLDAFSEAEPRVQEAARKQLAAMKELQKPQAKFESKSSTSEDAAQPASTETAKMSLPKPDARNQMVSQVVAKVPKAAATENFIRQASATASDDQLSSSVAFASNNVAPSPKMETESATETQPTDSAPKTKTIELTSESAIESPSQQTTKQQLDRLIEHFEDEDVPVDTPEGLRRATALRTLYLLADDPDQAMRKIEDLNSTEQEYIQYQLMTLWSILDPDGSPSRSRRWDKALENLRLASSHLAAATESLDVAGIAFCTEVESYGRISPFENYNFEPGQQVIVYCEIDNFAAERLSDGYETHFQGSYDLFNARGVRVAEQVLPADKQSCNNFRRDYFIAYRMYLPKQLEPGPHRIQLTIEDLKGKKFGQAVLDFDVVEKKDAASK